jgi:hypothetical protein
MMQPQPLIMLRDVEAGSRWFQQTLGLRSGHGGTDYEMLLDGSAMVAHLHAWDVDEHRILGRESDPSRGNGILLWFHTDDFDGIVMRVHDTGAEVLEGPLDNPNSKLREVWLRAPEGYVVVVSGT